MPAETRPYISFHQRWARKHCPQLDVLQVNPRKKIWLKMHNFMEQLQELDWSKTTPNQHKVGVHTNIDNRTLKGDITLKASWLELVELQSTSAFSYQNWSCENAGWVSVSSVSIPQRQSKEQCRMRLHNLCLRFMVKSAWCLKDVLTLPTRLQRSMWSNTLGSSTGDCIKWKFVV